MPVECRLCGDRPASGWLELCLTCRIAYRRGALALLGLEVLLVVLLTVVSWIARAQAAQLPELASRYECAGTVDGEHYQAPLTVTARGDHYVLDWQNGTIIGLGLRDENRLSVAFVQLSNGGVGVASYQIRPGQLLGRWAVGNGQVYREDCLVGQPAS